MTKTYNNIQTAAPCFQGELEYLHIKNRAAEAKIALQGAHIFHFKSRGKKPLLWLSESALFKKGTPIRGGVPICWPWFGPHPTDSALPNHGFARITLWEHISTKVINEEETRVTFELRSSSQSLQLWPWHFELSLEISISHELSITLTTKNTDAKAFEITQALHTYLAIDDISKLYVDGLDKKAYYNKVDNSFNNIQDGRLLFTEETDRIYQDVNSPVSVHQGSEIIEVNTKGSRSVVIWNPGEILARKMPDLSSHKTMLCIESSNVLNDAIRIEPNESYCLTTTISQD